MTITIHADRRPDRAGRPIPAGRSRDGSMRRPMEPVEIAKAAKGFIRSRTWRNWHTAEGQLRLRLPQALQVLALPALQALTRRPPSPGCHWCTVLMVTVVSGDPEPPRDPAHLELLGQPCAACERRHVIDQARQEGRRQAEFTAAATGELCRGRPWLTAALAASAAPGGDGRQLLDAMSRDVDRIGAHRAATRWGVPAGFFTGDRAATRVVARHPVFGPALRRPAATVWPPLQASAARRLLRRVPPPAYWRPRRRSIARAAAAGTYRVLQPGRPVAAPGANGGRRTYARP